MRGIAGCAAAGALVAALAAGWAACAPVPEPAVTDPRPPREIEAAQRDLRSLRRLATADKPDLGELWADWQRFRTAYAGTPEWVEACQVMAQAPSPLDRLDRDQIPAEDRPPWLPKEVVAVLGENRGRHWGEVGQIAVTPDNQVVAAGPEGVRLWDAALKERAFFPRAHCFALAAKKRLLALSRQKQVVLWDLSGERPKEGAAFPERPDDDVAYAESLAVTPDGRSLAVAWRRAEQGNVEVWDLTADKPRRRRTLPINPRQVEPSAVALSADGKWLSDDGGFGSAPVRLWDLTADEKKPPVVLEDTAARPLVFSPDGKWLVSGIHHTTGARLWDLSGEAPKSVRDLHCDGFTNGEVAFSPNGRTLATLGARQLHLWPVDEEGYKELGLTVGQTYTTAPLSLRALAVAFFPDGKRLALGCAGAVRLWDLGRSEELYPMHGHTSPVLAAAFSPDGRTLASGGDDDHTLRFWDLDAPAPRERAVVPLPGPIHDLAFRSEGRVALALTMDGQPNNSWLTKLRAWDMSGAKPKELWALEPHGLAAGACALSPNGQIMATTGIDELEDGYPPGISNVQIWEFEDGKPVRKGSIRLPPVFKGEVENHFINICGSQSFSPDGRLLACFAGTNDMRLVDVTAKSPKVKWVVHTVAKEGEESYIYAYGYAFAPNGKTLATGGYLTDEHNRQHPRVLLWDVAGARPTFWRALEEPGGDVMHIAFSPDGKTLAAVGLDGVLTLWDIEAGRKRQEWSLPGAVKAILFAPDGRHLATANVNGTLFIFRLAPPVKLGDGKGRDTK